MGVDEKPLQTGFSEAFHQSLTLQLGNKWDFITDISPQPHQCQELLKITPRELNSIQERKRSCRTGTGRNLVQGACFLRESPQAPAKGLAKGVAVRDGGTQPAEASWEQCDFRLKRCSPDGQQAGRGFISDSQISAVLGLILPRRKVVGADHRCSALAGEKCHASLRFGHTLSAGITCGPLMKYVGESSAKQKKPRRGLAVGCRDCAIHG